MTQGEVELNHSDCVFAPLANFIWMCPPLVAKRPLQRMGIRHQDAPALWAATSPKGQIGGGKPIWLVTFPNGHRLEREMRVYPLIWALGDVPYALGLNPPPPLLGTPGTTETGTTETALNRSLVHLEHLIGLLWGRPQNLSGPVWCNTAQYRETISAIPPHCALWGFWCLSMTSSVRYPLPFSEPFPLEEHAKWKVFGRFSASFWLFFS